MNFIIERPNPVRTIWFQPRATISWIVANDPNYLVLPLAALAGIATSINAWLAQLPVSGTEWSAELLLFMLGSGAAGGLLEIYLMAPVLRRVAKKWYPGALTAELRAALAWSKVPYLLILPLAVLVMFAALASEVNGPGLIAMLPAGGAASASGMATFFTCGTALLGVWVFILNLVLVSEVLGSSTLEAFGLQILAGLVLFVPFLLVDLVFAMVFELIAGTAW